MTGGYPLSRGFFAAETLRNGDLLLDIGCGDGFFTRRFFAGKCERIDAIDIDPDAIRAARRHNGAPNVTYHLMDATKHAFPLDRYDVVVWDGAIGHFSPEGADGILRKIHAALTPGGIFVGSESLGREGDDHLQYFMSVDELGALLRCHFKHVRTRSLAYRIGHGSFVREEAYWRCADEIDRLNALDWKEHSAGQ